MSIVAPGPVRLTVALMAVLPAALASPWREEAERWILGTSVGVLVLVLAWWGDAHLTTIAWRRLTLWSRRSRTADPIESDENYGSDVRTSVVLTLFDVPDRPYPLELIAGYLDRFGLTCESLRLTARDTAEGRTTWLGLTMSAASNLTALQARASDIPLRRAAENTMRRLADELRERGWQVSTVELDIPELFDSGAREGWRSLSDGTSGSVTAYGIGSDSLPEIGGLWSSDTQELWTAIEVSAAGCSAACAVRACGQAPPRPPLPGLVALHGRQRRALEALRPTATSPLVAPVRSADLDELSRWFTESGSGASWSAEPDLSDGRAERRQSVEPV